jgi:hypothetical protein
MFNNALLLPNYIQKKTKAGLPAFVIKYLKS